MNIQKIEERIEKLKEELKKERLENTPKRAREAGNTRNRIVEEINNNKKLLVIHTDEKYVHLRKLFKSAKDIEFFRYNISIMPRMFAKDNVEVNKDIKRLFRLVDTPYGLSYQYNPHILLKSYKDKAEELKEYFYDWHIEVFIKNVSKFKSFGIDSIETFNQFEELIENIEISEEKLDPVKILEAKLVGQKGIGVDFFPTPVSVCERMIEMADLCDFHTVLEPSAGNGNICDAILNQGNIDKSQIEVCEVSFQLRELLEIKGYNVVENDFMDLSLDKKYDKILMNPPFCADTEHIRKAYEHLKDDGILVSIISTSAMQNTTKKYIEFREWLDTHDWMSEQLESGTFNDKKLLNRTMASSYIIVIQKDL